MKPRQISIVAAACFHTLPGILALAEESSPRETDKRQYNLFHPTPRNLMREMSTDRPDKTESAYTVDAGHFQIEMDLVSYSTDRYNTSRQDVKVQSWSIAPMNLKLGLLNNVDFQLVLETYNSVRIDNRETGTVETLRGFGDMLPRLKINLWGNDGGPTALAVMPYVKLPTNQDGLGNDSVEGGIIFPFSADLPFNFGLGAMTQFDAVQDEDGSGRHPEFVNTITVSHDLVGKLSGYIEFFSAVSTESGSPWVGTVDLGFTYAVTDDIQLDAGINMGVTRSADDWNPFLGLSWRF